MLQALFYSPFYSKFNSPHKLKKVNKSQKKLYMNTLHQVAKCIMMTFTMPCSYFNEVFKIVLDTCKCINFYIF